MIPIPSRLYHPAPRGSSGCVYRGGAPRSSVGSAAGLQVRSLARGQHPGTVSRLRKCPLVAPPVGSPLPLAEVAAQDVLDVLHDQVDGHCGKDRQSAQPLRPPPGLKAGLDLLPVPGAAGPAAARGPGHPLPMEASRRRRVSADRNPRVGEGAQDHFPAWSAGFLFPKSPHKTLSANERVPVSTGIR